MAGVPCGPIDWEHPLFNMLASGGAQEAMQHDSLAAGTTCGRKTGSCSLERLHHKHGPAFERWTGGNTEIFALSQADETTRASDAEHLSHGSWPGGSSNNRHPASVNQVKVVIGIIQRFARIHHAETGIVELSYLGL